MKNWFKKAKKSIMFAVATAGAWALTATSVSATAILENDALDGLDTYGTKIGDFLGNLTPGLAKFIFTLSIILAVVTVIVGAIMIAKKFLGKGMGGYNR